MSVRFSIGVLLGKGSHQRHTHTGHWRHTGQDVPFGSNINDTSEVSIITS